MPDWFTCQLDQGSDYYLHGSVDIEPGAMIAAGVVLEAAAHASLVIQAGVCIGRGVIIQVWKGTLIIEADASVGSDVVVVGQGKIGTRACIGAESTLINPAIASEQVVPANSLLGDSSSQRPVLMDQPVPNGSQPPSSEAAEADPSTNGVAPAGVTSRVYGREQVEQLMNTLFPYRQQLNSSASEDSS